MTIRLGPLPIPEDYADIAAAVAARSSIGHHSGRVGLPPFGLPTLPLTRAQRRGKPIYANALLDAYSASLAQLRTDSPC